MEETELGMYQPASRLTLGPIIGYGKLAGSGDGVGNAKLCGFRVLGGQTRVNSTWLDGALA